MVYDNIAWLGNDGVLPVQFFPAGQNLSGCQRLLMAILDEALATLHWTSRTRNSHQADVLWNNAVEWVLSDDERYASFVYCCYHLGAAHADARRALQKRYGLASRIPYRQPYVSHHDRGIARQKRYTR